MTGKRKLIILAVTLILMLSLIIFFTFNFSPKSVIGGQYDSEIIVKGEIETGLEYYVSRDGLDYYFHLMAKGPLGWKEVQNSWLNLDNDDRKIILVEQMEYDGYSLFWGFKNNRDIESVSLNTDYLIAENEELSDANYPFIFISESKELSLKDIHVVLNNNEIIHYPFDRQVNAN